MDCAIVLPLTLNYTNVCVPYSALNGMGIGALIGLFSPLLFALALYILGFGCIGITLGSCAASMMSYIHPVASGSVYACKYF